MVAALGLALAGCAVSGLGGPSFALAPGRLAFGCVEAVDPNAEPTFSIRVLRLAAHAAPQPVVRGDRLHAWPSWSADGKHLAFVIAGAEGSAIHLVDSDGRNARWLVAGDDPAWSPDGERLAFTQRSAPEDYGAIAVIPASGGTPAVITAPGARPTWSPDGRHLAFMTPVPGVLGRGARTAVRVEIADVSGARRHPLAVPGFEQQGTGDPRWSPDGTRILFDTAALDQGGILSARPDGSGIRQHSPNGTNAVWSPDGRWIAFLVRSPIEGQPPEIRVVKVSGGRAETLLRGGRPCGDFAYLAWGS